MVHPNPYFYASNIELLSYENAWVQYMKSGEKNISIIKPEIYHSWDRCKAAAMDPLCRKAPEPLPKEQLDERLHRESYLLSVVIPFMENLYELIDPTRFLVNVTDPQGVILKTIAHNAMLDIRKKTKSFPGADRSEAVSGTNSINLAIRLKKPVQIAGCQHFQQLFQRWSCSSAPVCGPSGDVLCVLNISGAYGLVNDHTLGMVSSAAKAIENQLYINKVNFHLKKANTQLNTILGMITDGILYAEQGKAVYINPSLCALLGKSEKDMLDSHIFQTIETQPPLKALLSAEQKTLYNEQILIKGTKRNCKCLFSCERVQDDKKTAQGVILRFTQAETIELMASKIRYSAKYTFHDLIGESRAFHEAVCLAQRAAKYDSRVIIQGESGTGKEMFAQAIHNSSHRKQGPFLAVDCGTIPRELFESEFFGYEKGAFTGASKDGKIGFVEKAEKGTLFLDEIGNLPLDMQIKLLRVLQEGLIFRVGGTTPIDVNIRVIAATNADLEKEIEKGNFREDLFYRLNVFNIHLPPLRERSSDIPLLVRHFLQNNPDRGGHLQIEKAALDILQKFSWPGNVRQLANAVERAVIMSDGRIVKADDLSKDLRHQEFSGKEYFTVSEGSLDAVAAGYTLFRLQENNNNVSKTARELKISRATVYNILAKHGYDFLSAKKRIEESGNESV